MSCDSSYGGGCASRVVGDSWYVVTTEFDGAYVRRIELGDPDGGRIACERVVELGGPVVSFDTADGRTFWCVAGSLTGLPEVYRVELGAAAGSEAPAREAPARAVRVTDCSRALEGRLVSPPEPFEFESNGATLTGYVIKPVGYDGTPDGETSADGSAARRAYPAVLEIHGGPKVAYGTQFSHEMQVLVAGLLRPVHQPARVGRPRRGLRGHPRALRPGGLCPTSWPSSTRRCAATRRSTPSGSP